MADSVATNGGGTVAAAEGGGEGAQEQQQPGWGEMIKGMLWRFLIMYFIMNLFKGKQTPTAPNTTEGGVATTTGAIQARNLFARGTVMDLYLYISEFEKMKWKDEKTGKSSTGESLNRDPYGAHDSATMTFLTRCKGN